MWHQLCSKLSVILAVIMIPSLVVGEKPAGTVVFFRDQDEKDVKSVYFEIEGDDSGLIIGCLLYTSDAADE